VTSPATDPTVEHHTFCRICPVLCGLVVETQGAQVVQVRGDRDHPVTHGYSCPKGRALGEFHHHPLRLDQPRLHGANTTWDHLLGDLASRLARIISESGPDSVAVYFGTWSWMDAFGRMRAESLLRHIGSRSRYSAITVDAIARLTVAEMVGGFGGLLPAIDPDNAGLTVLIGTNPVVSHGHAGALVDPVATLRRLANGAGLWVVDPRRTESARLASRHLAVRPGSDHALLAYVVRSLLEDGADREYVEHRVNGVEQLRDAVAPWTRDVAAARTGLTGDDVDALVDAIRASHQVTVVTGTGTTMGPAANVTEWLAWAVQILTGSFEHERGAWFNPGAFLRLDRGTVAPAPPEGNVATGAPSRPELVSRFGERPCSVLADEIESGNVRALLVIGGDPLTSLPDTNRLERAFRQLDVLAVADVIEADTVAMATHVLAVAGQLERDDVNWFTDRFSPVISAQRTDAVLPPGAGRRTMVDVLQDLGELLGLARDEAQLSRVLARVPELDGPGVVLGDVARVRGWVHDRVLPEGRWRIAPAPLVAQLHDLGRGHAPDLVAIPRRAMRRMNSALRDVGRGAEDADIWCHPDDAVGFADGELVELVSAAGSITATLRITDNVVRGAVSVPHGLTGQNVNRLTGSSRDVVDALTGMVTQSGIPVRLSPAAHERNAGSTS
jgi:anaerobic selenocysteine-containing dehydrogenase